MALALMFACRSVRQGAAASLARSQEALTRHVSGCAGRSLSFNPDPMLQRTSRSFTLLLGAQSALPPLSIDMSLPALPMLGAALGASAGSAQWTLSGFLLGFAFGQLILGPASDRLGRRPVLIAGLIVYALAGAATAAAPTISALILLRLLQGFGACAGVVISRTVVRDVFEGPAAVARQSMLTATATLAMLLAPMIGAALLGSLGWRAVYGALSVAGFALLAVTAVLQHETLRASRQRAASLWSGYARVLRTPRTLGYAAVNALTFGGMFAYISASPTVFIGTLGVTPGVFSVLFALAALAMLAGSLCNGWLARRRSAVSLQRLGPVLLGIAIALVCGLGIAIPHVPVLVCVLAAYTFAAGIVMPNAITAGLAPLPEAAGAAAAFIGGSQMIAGGLSAAIVGLVLPGTVLGMAGVLGVFGVAALGVAVLMECGLPGDRSQAAQPQ